MSTFKVGDRVAVYRNETSITPQTPGTVRALRQYYEVVFDMGACADVSELRLTKLPPKKPTRAEWLETVRELSQAGMPTAAKRLLQWLEAYEGAP